MSVIQKADQCCTPCHEPVVVDIPGTAGENGDPGEPGADGVDAFSLTTGEFEMPAELANVTVNIEDSAFLGIGQIVFVEFAGFMQVVSIPDGTSVELENLEDSVNGLYADNAPPTTSIPSGSKVSPAGPQGPAGASGSGTLNSLSPTGAKGQILADNGANSPAASMVAVSPGANGTRLRANSAATAGLDWQKVDLSSSAEVVNALAIANGGTGQTTANPAFNALAPTTTRGDLITRDATVNVRLALGAAGTVLKAGATDPAYGFILPANIDPTYKLLPGYGLLGSLIAADFNVTTDQAITINAARYIIRRIVVQNASISLTTAVGGIYSNAGKAGTIVVANTQVYSALTTSSKWVDLTLASAVTTDVLTAATLYFSLTTAQGAAATASVYLYGEVL